MAQELARRIGFSQTDALAVRTAVEEGCSYVMDRAFEPNERAQVRLLLEMESRGLRIRIRDQGLPLDTEALEKNLESGSTLPRHLGVRLLRAMVDEVSFRHLGRDGNEINLFKQLKGQLPRFIFRELEKDASTPDLESLQVRRALPEEALGISRCIYRSYGYSYTGEENVYSPEWLAQMNRNQMMVSAVAVADDEVVGHVALMRMESPRPVYDLGQAAVIPSCRARGLLKQLISFLLEQAEELGMEIIYADPVTSHTHSQKAVRDFGFTEVGLMLASVGKEVQLKGESEVPERLSLLPCLRVLRPPPQLEIHTPEVYGEFIDETLRRTGLMACISMGKPAAVLGRRTALFWGVHSLTQKGFIRVQKVGRDAAERLESTIRHLLAERVAAIHLDLDLCDPGCPFICQAARKLGFFYCALLPGMGEGLVLRLQYMNQQILKAEDIHLLTEWAEKVRNFVLADLAEVLL